MSELVEQHSTSVFGPAVQRTGSAVRPPAAASGRSLLIALVSG
jgi:hypothetical protein